MTGNDIYSRLTGLPSASDKTLLRMSGNATEVTDALLGIAEAVIVLGPVVRLDGEILPVQWEDTAAYAAERHLKHTLPREVDFVPVGRQLTKKLWKRAHCVSDCKQWYELDQIHINPEGFRKMAAAEGLPSWIRFRDGA
ncbi:hypothetical protein FJT64_025935 [Amphibalanus amphitrite]|uniref:Isoamyl acetate-hydrolyzing esterase 1 n=1 Tax=Amphibalanus amphitrite TaxID=1232801 RepID=A0A6A4WEA5_AMPAM|nr:hypothetical protein FJT64_025935 [Amphibalanus amphitrite]